MKKRVVVRKSKNVLTPLNKKLLIVLIVVVLAGAVIAVLNGGVTGFASLTGINSKAALLAYRDLAAQTNPEGVAAAESYGGDMDRDGIPDTYDPCTKYKDTIRTRRVRVGSVYKTVAVPFPNADKDKVIDRCDKYPNINHVALGQDSDGDGVPNREDPRINVAGEQQPPTKVTARATPPPALAARPSGTATPAIVARPSGTASPGLA